MELDDLEACNSYQLDLNNMMNIILGDKDRLVDLKAVDKFSDKNYLRATQKYTKICTKHTF